MRPRQSLLAPPQHTSALSPVKVEHFSRIYERGRSARFANLASTCASPPPPPLDPLVPEIDGWRAAALSALAGRAADGLMVCSFGLLAGGGGGVCGLFCPSLASPDFHVFCGRTPMQAHGRPLPKASLSVFACSLLCACSRKDSHTTTKNPLHTHPPSRQDSLLGPFFFSRAIPLLASEASLLLYPYHTRFGRDLSLFLLLLLLFSGTDWLMIGHV